MKMQIYVDASFEGYGAIFWGDSKIIAMFNCVSTKKYEHFNTSNVEGLVRTLLAFGPFILGQQFIVHPDN